MVWHHPARAARTHFWKIPGLTRTRRTRTRIPVYPNPDPCTRVPIFFKKISLPPNSNWFKSIKPGGSHLSFLSRTGGSHPSILFFFFGFIKFQILFSLQSKLYIFTPLPLNIFTPSHSLNLSISHNLILSISQYYYFQFLNSLFEKNIVVNLIHSTNTQTELRRYRNYEVRHLPQDFSSRFKGYIYFMLD